MSLSDTIEISGGPLNAPYGTVFPYIVLGFIKNIVVQLISAVFSGNTYIINSDEYIIFEIINTGRKNNKQILLGRFTNFSGDFSSQDIIPFVANELDLYYNQVGDGELVQFTLTLFSSLGGDLVQLGTVLISLDATGR